MNFLFEKKLREFLGTEKTAWGDDDGEEEEDLRKMNAKLDTEGIYPKKIQ